MTTNSQGASEAIYEPAFYDALNDFDFDFDVPFYSKLARAARGPVLELCCGSGRITLPLARQGVRITGADRCRPMLQAARRKAKDEGLEVPFVCADMRKLRLAQRFKLVFIPFNSLQHTYSLRDVERVFETVRRHLAPGGRFAFDVFNPSIHYMVRGEKQRKGAYRFRLSDGKAVRIDEQSRYDSAAQVNRVTWHCQIAGQPVQPPSQLDMRCFFPLELEALLKYNGFKIEKRFGSFEEAPFGSDSMKQVFVCHPA